VAKRTISTCDHCQREGEGLELFLVSIRTHVGGDHSTGGNYAGIDVCKECLVKIGHFPPTASAEKGIAPARGVPAKELVLRLAVLATRNVLLGENERVDP